MPGFGDLFRRMLEKRINLSERVEGPVALIVSSRSSAVKIRGSPDPMARVIGSTRLYGAVSMSRGLSERLGPTIVVSARGARISVEAPVKALVVAASSSAVRASELEVDFVSLKASHSAISISARVRPGGGLLARATGSSIKGELYPASPGEYWIEIEASGSSIRVVTPDGSSYLLEEPVPRTVALRVAEKRGDSVFKVRIAGRASSIALS